jgi:transcriptional regulator with PAS, ATPase and Fis domain
MDNEKQFNGIVGKSKPTRQMTTAILKVAPHDFSVLIRGESGTGKELVARSIQTNSKRIKGPFVPVNCGAIPDGLLEAHLFGHQKGSCTGASYDRPGIFEVADGGTVFLDEIGEMPLTMQVKLLRALQEKELFRVGSTRPIKVDIRLIAATNRDLNTMIGAGQFRQDLYYRISTLQIEVPALRQRREDIPLLAEHFLQKLRPISDFQQPVKIDQSALERLVNYDWPGNVRELENVISRLIVHTQASVITAMDIEAAIGASEKSSQDGQAALEETPEFNLALPSSILRVSDRETMASYLKRVKFELLQTAIIQYPDRTAVAERLGLAEDRPEAAPTIKSISLIAQTIARRIHEQAK